MFVSGISTSDDELEPAFSLLQEGSLQIAKN
jgi:hypothetical protein